MNQNNKPTQSNQSNQSNQSRVIYLPQAISKYSNQFGDINYKEYMKDKQEKLTCRICFFMLAFTMLLILSTSIKGVL